MRTYAAVVLAGGAARRLGGAEKPSLLVGGHPMLHRVLSAVTDASPRIVVGPPGLPVPAGTRRTREEPPGGGPVAATDAGLALVGTDPPLVALLAADLPFLTPDAVARLRRAAAEPGRDGAVFIDETGHPQWLCGVWRTDRLRERIAALPRGPSGASLGALLRDASVAYLPGGAGAQPPPWYDCDTEADLRRARHWDHPG